MVLYEEWKQRGRIQELQRGRICSQIPGCAELLGDESLGAER